MTKIAIVGGGLAGTCLAKLFTENGDDIHWYSDNQSAASHISSGILNPITGRRYALAWRYDELLNIAKEFYGNYLTPIRLEKHFSPFNNEISIDEVIHGKEKYLSKINDEWIEVKESYQLQTNAFIENTKLKLKNSDNIVTNSFNHSLLKFSNNQWHYQSEIYDQIFFAEGIQVKNNPFFCHLPFQPNRGEALIVNIPDDKPDAVRKHGKFICPFGEHFWLGSSFDKVDMDAPLMTEKAKLEMINAIPNLVHHVAYQIMDHVGALRSTTPDRRPIIGEHPSHKGLFLFNGFGTKGASLIPWCSLQLFKLLKNNESLPIEISIDRLKKFTK